MREAQEYGVQGKAVTPYILARIVALSGGRSLRTNIALAQSNARRGSRNRRSHAFLTRVYLQ